MSEENNTPYTVTPSYLEPVLMEHIRTQCRFELKGAVHAFTENAILTAVQELKKFRATGATSQNEESLFKKARWIVRTQERIRTFHPLPAPKRYISGETLLYLGRQYRLKIDQGDPATARLKGKFLVVSTRDKTDRDAVKRKVDQWYRERAEETFRRYLASCVEVGARHDIPEPTLTLRKMKTRWGSCNSKGRITINTNLVQAPVHCIEYVIMHELCHLKHMNHSKAFYRLLTQCMPDWKKRKEALHRIVLPWDK